MFDSDDQRPDPDQLLAHVQREEEHLTRGRLKIFLGYAAGVGKTYAMLEAAHQRLAEGVDVVVGYVETHGRAETEALLAGLEVIPRQQVIYHGTVLEEMDLDAVLARRPGLVLVDELAHSNAPGVRHSKRYLDVEELLAAGIDVYTTLNIQHVESLNDVVAQITGVTVHEKVPDGVVDEADEIELVDLPPQELVRRLKEGKVYVPDQASRAIEKFFRLGNLTALREVAMRRAAERIDTEMRAYMRTRAIPGPWPAADRLLVCVSPGPGSERLIHATRRLANQLNAEWFALYVETPDDAHLPPPARRRLAQHMQLAQDLGARVRTLPGASVAEAVLHYARKHNVTKIIAGKPLRSRWQELFSGSIVDQIIRHSRDIDVYVIIDPLPAAKPDDAITARPQLQWRRYGVSLALVTGVTLFAQPLASVLTPTNLVMLYLATVVVAALYLGRGPSVLAALSGVLAFDYFYVPPQLTFALGDSQYLLTFVGLFLVSIVISSLMDRVRAQAHAAERREAQATELNELSRDLAAAGSLEAIIQAVLAHVAETFGRQAAVLLPAPYGLPEDGRLEVQALSPDFQLDQNELAVATWAFRHGQQAGRGTDTLPAANNRYLPMKTVQGVLGVLGVRPGDPAAPLLPEQRWLLETFASQAAMAIERGQLAEHARQAQIVQATERLQSTLLNTYSNVRVCNEPTDVRQVINMALEDLPNDLDGRTIELTTPPNLPAVPMDPILIVQVLINLLDHAVKSSPTGAPITVSVRQTLAAGGQLEIAVTDRGGASAADDLTHIFDQNDRARPPHRAGRTGVGLSICKRIVEAHGGHIWAQNSAGGGLTIAFALPLHPPSESISSGVEGEVGGTANSDPGHLGGTQASEAGGRSIGNE
jgi:two-component system, OmpR family, sensor histidine kinase KdpD